MRAALATLTLALAAAAAAQDVSITGTNTVRFERYDTDGHRAASPFPVSTTTGYDELVLNLNWQASSFDRWRGLFAGVANDSPYRSPHRGFVPERMAIARENGEAAIPYRAEAGDFFAFTSLRTQQRPLKGLALELQPVLARPDLRTSVLLFAGAFQPSWRDFQWGDDNSLGLSWLTEIRDLRVTFNALRNERGASPALAAAERRQSLASVAAEAPFRVAGSLWRAEGELAMLREDRNDYGWFAQLSGGLAAVPAVSWRLRGERYGRDYRPIGAPIAPDRRALEAHASFQSAGGLNWRARAQEYRDFLESGNPLDTRVLGAALFGPVAPLAATLNLDVFAQELERRDRTVDQRAFTANAFVSRPFGPVVAQVGALYQRMDDRLLADADPRTKQVSLQVTAPLRLGSVSGSLTPGVSWREVTGSPAATRDVQASLQLAVFGGPHRLSLSAGRLAQDPSAAVAPEIATVNFAADYRYRWGRHEVGADVVLFDRKPRPGEKTQAWRAGLLWVYAFDASPQRAPAPVAIAASAGGPLALDVGLASGIAPGDDLDASLTRLSASGLSGGVRLPALVAFETRLLREVDHRQRLVLAHSAGRVERSAIVVSLAPGASAQEVSAAFEATRRALIDRFGRPASTFESGTFSAAYAGDVLAGRLVRIAEWRTDRGTLRLGLPRRLDGTVRIEIHHAAAFASPREPGWGLDALP